MPCVPVAPFTLRSEIGARPITGRVGRKVSVPVNLPETLFLILDE